MPQTPSLVNFPPRGRPCSDSPVPPIVPPANSQLMLCTHLPYVQTAQHPSRSTTQHNSSAPFFGGAQQRPMGAPPDSESSAHSPPLHARCPSVGSPLSAPSAGWKAIEVGAASDRSGAVESFLSELWNTLRLPRFLTNAIGQPAAE